MLIGSGLRRKTADASTITPANGDPNACEPHPILSCAWENKVNRTYRLGAAATLKVRMFQRASPHALTALLAIGGCAAPVVASATPPSNIDTAQPSIGPATSERP